MHARFRDLPDHLRPGDLLVVNESATIPAALPARRADGTALELHLSTPEPPARDGGATREAVASLAARPPGASRARWVVELRRGGERFRDARCGERLALAGGGTAELVAPYLSAGRLWIARARPARAAARPPGRPRPADPLRAPDPPAPARGPPDGLRAGPRERRDAERRAAVHRARRCATCATAASPSRRSCCTPASAPRSAASARTRSASPCPRATAAAVRATRAAGGRVIAVGTTVTRALETAAGDDGTLRARSGLDRRW